MYTYFMIENEEDLYFSLSVGDTVPNLSFKVFHKGEMNSSSFETYRGTWLALVFYPADFTFVCPTELGELASLYGEFQKEGVEILSMSTDTTFAHKMWHQTSDTIKKIEFPMGSDACHDLSYTFGVHSADEGSSHRGTFIINPEGVIKSVEINDDSIGRSAKELLRKVRAAKYTSENPGQVCPASWEKGDGTLKPGVSLVGEI